MKFNSTAKQTSNPLSLHNKSTDFNSSERYSRYQESVVSERRLVLPESIKNDHYKQQYLQKSWRDQKYKSIDGSLIVSPHQGWKKQTLDTFRQSLQDKKEIVERYLDKQGNYKKLSCVIKPPSQFVRDLNTHNNGQKDQPLLKSVTSSGGRSKEFTRGRTLSPFSEITVKSIVSKSPEQNYLQSESQDSIDQVVYQDLQNNDHFQKNIKVKAFRIAKKQMKKSQNPPTQIQKSVDKHSLLKSGVIFVDEGLKNQPCPLKTFNYRFFDQKQQAAQSIKDNTNVQVRKESFDLSNKVQNIYLMKQKPIFTAEEIFFLKDAEKQPSYLSDNYLHEKLKLEIQAARGQPKSYEENLKELEIIQQRRQMTDQQISDFQVKKTADYEIVPRKVFQGVPSAKQECEILGEVERLRLRIQKKESNGLMSVHEDPLRFPETQKLKDLFQDLNLTKTEALALKIAKNSNKVVAQMEIQTVKKSFLQQLQTSQIDKYVADTISHVKNQNKLRDFTIINLKQSLRINVEEELHREEQKQAVRDLIKKHDIFGVGFEEFQLLLKSDEETFVKVTQVLSETFKQNDVFKKSQGVKILEANPSDPKFQFLRSCKEDLSICLPILDKIVNKKLALYSYTLSEGHCKALANACKLLNGKLNGLVFDSCAISDLQLAEILNSISTLSGFKSIVCRKNAFETNSLKALRLLLNKAKPNQLTDLKLIECKISANITSVLLEQLQIKCSLERLTLVHCNMTEASFKSLIDVVDYSSELKQLDISWCEVSSKNYFDLFVRLSENRTLTHLNLSWNNLFDPKVEEDGSLSKESLNSIAKLSTFIQNNNALVHLDMRQTGLSAQIIRLLVSAVRESSSLLSVHMCGNPGLSRKLILEIQAILGSKDSLVPENHIPSFGKARDGDFNSYTVQETLALKSILKNKKLQEVNLGILSDEKKKLILERNLSLSHLIPDSQIWRIITQEHRNCFLCDQHILGIFFWSKELYERQTNPVDKPTSTYYEKKTMEFFDQDDKRQNLPTLQASFTNWQPVPLLELSQLCLQINGVIEPDWVEYLHSREKIRPQVKSYVDMNEKELRKVRKRIVEFKQQQLQEWPRTLLDGIQPYKKVQLVNGKILADAITSKQIDLLKQPVYCGVFFMRAGRQHFVVREEQKAYVFKDIVKFREEEVAL